MSDCDACRRGLLKAGVSGVAALVVPACGGSPSGSADAGDPDAGGDGASDCEPTCSSSATTVTVTFEQYPTLLDVGGSALVRVAGYKDPNCGMNRIIVVQSGAGRYIALSAGCSHQCCAVGYDASHEQFLCPCHQSTYALTGAVTHGPATKPLQNLTVCADACGVTITLP